MPIQILMPTAAGDAADAAVARWAHRPGDAVRKGVALVDIETDKAVVEVEAPADGVLAVILVPEGTRGLPADAVLGLIATAGEDAKTVAAAAAASPAAAAPGAPPAAAATTASEPGASAEAPTASRRIAASPLARRLARQAGLAITGLSGSGPHGRIVKVDIERALAARPTAPAAAPTSPPPPRTVATAATLVPHTPMRRIIAQRLAESKRTIPHFYLSVDCDVQALLALRSQLDALVGFKPSVNDFVVRAVALAMKRVPSVNASWGDEGMRQHASVDVSVAVATPGGLVTPIVRQADGKTLAMINAEVKALAARAREGRLKPDEYQGGGFTISNLGMHGVREFYAIVNPPQSAILAVGACEARPVVRNGQVVAGMQMTCSLSADHRVIDGAVGAEFLATVRGLLEAPLALLA